MSKPILYYALFSPPARACILTAKMIGLDLNLKFVDFSKKQHLSEEFMKINPQHQIPVLVDTDGEVYVDSHAIICFLVSKYGNDDKLYPKDLKLRAHVDHRLHFEGGVLFQALKDIVMRNLYWGETDLNPKSIDKCLDAYKDLELFLSKNEFVAGNQLTVADISIDTTLITLNLLVPVEENRFPKTFSWMQKMRKLLPDYETINLEGSKSLVDRISNMMAANKAKSQ